LKDFGQATVRFQLEHLMIRRFQGERSNGESASRHQNQAVCDPFMTPPRNPLRSLGPGRLMIKSSPTAIAILGR